MAVKPVAKVSVLVGTDQDGANPNVAAAMLDACRAPSLAVGGPQMRELGVTSSIYGEGRTSIALALAVLQSQDYGRTAVLVEMSVEAPALAQRLHLAPAPGLCEWAYDEVSLDQVMQPLQEGVSVVVAGNPGQTPARAISESLRRGLIGQLGKRFDSVIIDLPPVSGIPWGAALASEFANLLFVVRSGVTPASTVRKAYAAIPTPPKVLLNSTSSSLPGWLRRLIG